VADDVDFGGHGGGCFGRGGSGDGGGDGGASGCVVIGWRGADGSGLTDWLVGLACKLGCLA